MLGLLPGGFRVATDWAERAGMYAIELNPQLEGWGYHGALAALGRVFALCAFQLLALEKSPLRSATDTCAPPVEAMVILHAPPRAALVC